MGISEETELLKMTEIKGSIQQEHLKHVQILKTAHHGSKGSSSPGFLGKMPLRLHLFPMEKIILRSSISRSYGTDEETKYFFYETGGNGAWILENKDRKVIIKRAVKLISS